MMTDNDRILFEIGIFFFLIIIVVIGIWFIGSTQSTCTYHAYQLSNGEIVWCEYMGVYHGGASLSTCRDGKEYYAQTNVVDLNTKEVEAC